MALVSLKCPNCGGSIQIDNTRDKAYCTFCGSPFLVKDEIQRVQIQHSGSVMMDVNIESMIRSAVGFCKLEKWKEARELYNKMVVQNSTDYRGWWGLFLVKTHNMTLLHKQDGLKFTTLDIADAYNAIKVAPQNAKIYLTTTLNSYIKKSRELYQLKIYKRTNIFTMDEPYMIKIDYSYFVTISNNTPVELMVPSGHHIIILCSITNKMSSFEFEMTSNISLAIKVKNGSWAVVSTERR